MRGLQKRFWKAANERVVDQYYLTICCTYYDEDIFDAIIICVLLYGITLTPLVVALPMSKAVIRRNALKIMSGDMTFHSKSKLQKKTR